MTVLESMLAADRYHSQFETHTSNGGLSAEPGGDRARWEDRIFGGAYANAGPAERPVYGALNHRRHAEGGSPRFGSVHLRLRRSVLDRATFCYPDSVFEPVRFGTADRMDLIGLIGAGRPDQLDRLDRLDDYVEAHLHVGWC